jgi:hypothetical protein
MSGNLFGSCINGNPCGLMSESCMRGKDQDKRYPQFGNTNPEYDSTNSAPISTNSQKTVYGGLLNSRRIKQYASMYILAKGSLATVDRNYKKTTLGNNIQDGNSDYDSGTNYTNVGGPGDQDKSVPLGITGFSRGNKARVYSMPGRDDGVDVKHGSYNRYLARKKGIALRCSNC